MDENFVLPSSLLVSSDDLLSLNIVTSLVNLWPKAQSNTKRIKKTFIFILFYETESVKNHG